MSLRNFIAAASVALALAGSAGAVTPQAPDTARVAQGELRGQVKGAVASFKGIPFAAPPIGDLRWRPPQPAAPWAGVRDATAYGPMCMQMRAVPAGTNQSEDCLTLNVWTPANRKPGAKLPVMVWIHGGSFTGGSGSNAIYDGTHFAERGVVLVTVNYRLGRLGFFYHPALAAEHPGEPLANYGMMDNLAALKWVQANIAAFGGDPANVTAFGESAGGILINDLMASPQAKGLFAKAISESGFGRIPGLPMKGDGPNTAEKQGLAYAGSFGVTGTGPDALKAMRALTPAQLSAPAGQVTPILDGVILPEGPAVAFAAGRELKVPYIAGGNSWEASLFPKNTPLDRAGPLRDKLVAAYGAPTDLMNVQWDLGTEAAVIEPDRLLARLHTKNGQKAWVYYMSYIPAIQRASVHGMSHGGELMYVFNTLPDHDMTIGTRMVAAATPADRKIADAMTAYWTAFAKGSDPDSAGGPAWPAYTPANDAVLEFGADGVNLRPAFHKASLDLVEQLASTGAGR
ncbi:MAG TPA: carboxylesterase family protein [Phenylobacterium sp.]